MVRLFDLKRPEAIFADEFTSETLVRQPDGLTLYHVRPFVDTPGFESASAFIRGLDPGIGHRVTVEPWYDDARVKFVVGVPDRDDLEDVVTSHFPDSVIEDVDQPFPPIRSGEWLAGARLELTMDCCFPIRTDHDHDPYQTLIPKLTGADTERAVFQVTFRPVSTRWYRRGIIGSDTDKIADGRGEGRVVGQLNPTVVATSTDRAVKADMQAQRGRAAYQTVVRVFAITDSKENAERRVEAIATCIESEFTNVSGQTLSPVYLRRNSLRREVQGATMRTIPSRSLPIRWLRGTNHVLTDREVAGLAHLPNASINAPDVNWAKMPSGGGVPPEAPQFSFAEEQR